MLAEQEALAGETDFWDDIVRAVRAEYLSEAQELVTRKCSNPLMVDH